MQAIKDEGTWYCSTCDEEINPLIDTVCPHCGYPVEYDEGEDDDDEKLTIGKTVRYS